MFQSYSFVGSGFLVLFFIMPLLLILLCGRRCQASHGTCEFREWQDQGGDTQHFQLKNTFLKLEVTCLIRAVNFYSSSLLLSLVISSTHGTALKSQILGETCEGLVQTCMRQLPKQTALSLAGVRAGPARITPLTSLSS